MRILPFEGALSARLPNNTQGGVGALTAAESGLALAVKVSSGSVSLSSLSRAVADALTQGLPADTSLHLDELLTADDRLLLDWMSELTKAGGVDAGEVRKLVVDLVAYRRAEVLLREPAAFPTESYATAPSAPSGQPTAGAAAAAARPFLSLPTLAAPDEALARTILTRLSARDSLVDPGFVRALLDPDRAQAPRVDLAFLARMVVDLSRARPGAPVDLGAAFARRDARVVLAQALSSLALPRDELAQVVKDSAERGRTLLRQQFSRFAARLEFEPAWEPVLPAAQRAQSVRPQVSLLTLLTRNDRALLGVLYESARVRGGDLKAVDNVARALIGLRESEHAVAQQTQVDVALPSMPASELNGLQLPRRAPSPPALGVSFDQAVDDPLEPRVSPESLAPDSFANAIPRSFGSATQMAAKLAGSYASLVPPNERYRAAPSSRAPAAPSVPSLAQLAQPLGVGAHLPQLGPPLNVVQALGLSGLIAELHAQLLRVPRRRRQKRKVRLRENVAAGSTEVELDDLTRDSHRRRGVRWELLARRRRARLLPG